MVELLTGGAFAVVIPANLPTQHVAAHTIGVEAGGVFAEFIATEHGHFKCKPKLSFGHLTPRGETIKIFFRAISIFHTV